MYISVITKHAEPKDKDALINRITWQKRYRTTLTTLFSLSAITEGSRLKVDPSPYQ